MNNLIALIKIPAGRFRMGSPDDEPRRFSDENPQHSVSVPSFLMGKYPVTQAQWKAVAALPEVEKYLDPDPAYFKGNDRPVERVSWYDAVEFCQRLSKKTGQEYRLPSEAQWEYACRARTTTPFYFGDTLTSDLANYSVNLSYGDRPKEQYRAETIDVGSFLANDFGLYDMHGNVYEWCQDHWHDNYDGAPTDGSAWLTDDEKAKRLMRGGSWNSYPRYCRSACRYTYTPNFRFNDIGFRVVCSYNEEN